MGWRAAKDYDELGWMVWWCIRVDKGRRQLCAGLPARSTSAPIALGSFDTVRPCSQFPSPFLRLRSVLVRPLDEAHSTSFALRVRSGICSSRSLLCSPASTATLNLSLRSASLVHSVCKLLRRGVGRRTHHTPPICVFLTRKPRTRKQSSPPSGG